MRARSILEVVLPLIAGLVLLGLLADIWAARLTYPFDLEWMEGGMLAHAWRLQQGLPLYVPPNPDFVPFIYPPGYAAVLATLGQVVGLSPTLGRAVSLIAILAAAAAIGFGVRGEGGSRMVAWGSAAVFLGAYPMAGAFYDLVRPDSLAVALLAWSVVLALRTRPGAPVAAGLLLAAAFLCKQNLALFGLPIALGLAVRNRRDAGWFVLASAGPALGAIGILQLASDGHFLTYLLEVPRSHTMLWHRALRDTPAELGSAMPVALGVAGWGLYLRGLQRPTVVPTWLAATVPMWLGVLVAWAGTYVPPPPGSDLLPLPTAIAYWALVVGILGPVLGVVSTAISRRRGSAGPLLSWRAVLGLGVAATAVAASLLMRAHDGGYVNVHMPTFWVIAFGFGITLSRWSHRAPRGVGDGVGVGVVQALATVAVTGQLLFAISRLHRDEYVPTSEDLATGWAFVERARPIEGPILSPFAAWLPVYAGKPPSVHAMALWDLNYPAGPYNDELSSVRDALRNGYWPMAFGGNQHLLGPLVDDYEPVEVITEENSGPLMPKTGLRAYPWRIMVPRPGVE